MNITPESFKFVYTNLRNKPYISFCVHLLIGILFSFPVFSTQGSVDHDPSASTQYTIADDCQAGYISYAEDQTGSAIQFSKSSPKKSFDHQYFPGDKHNTSIDLNYQWHNELSSRIIAADLKYHNSGFVNISYLKDLRTTKMLC